MYGRLRVNPQVFTANGAAAGRHDTTYGLGLWVIG